LPLHFLRLQQCVGQTNASIQTIFLHNDKDHQVVIAGGLNRYAFNKSKMASGRHFEKPLNRHILQTSDRFLMKFGMMTHIGTVKVLIF